MSLDEPYKLGLESLVQDGVSKGVITEYQWGREGIL